VQRWWCSSEKEPEKELELWGLEDPVDLAEDPVEGLVDLVEDLEDPAVHAGLVVRLSVFAGSCSSVFYAVVAADQALVDRWEVLVQCPCNAAVF